MHQESQLRRRFGGQQNIGSAQTETLVKIVGNTRQLVFDDIGQAGAAPITVRQKSVRGSQTANAALEGLGKGLRIRRGP